MPAAEGRGDEKILEHCERPEGQRNLMGASDACACSGPGGCLSDILSIEPDDPRVGLERSGDEIEERRLAGAIRADDAERYTLSDIEIDLVGDFHRPEGFAYAFKLKDHSEGSAALLLPTQAIGSILPPVGIAGKVWLSTITMS